MEDSRNPHECRIRFGAFELDVESAELRKGGVRLRLEGLPIQVLRILLERTGRLVTRDELRNRLWPSDTFVDFDHGINTAIKKLRQALDDSADAPRYIETLPRRGYRFICPQDIGVDTPQIPRTLWCKQHRVVIPALVLVVPLVASLLWGLMRPASTRLASEPAHATHRRPIHPQAYDFYLKGIALRAEWSKPENVRVAIADFDRAIEIDPGFSRAYGERSLAYLIQGAALIEAVPAREVIEKARRSARRALELDPNNAEAYEALGWIAHNHDWDWAAAETNYARAIDLNPDSPAAYTWYSQYLNVRGRHQEALLFIRKAFQLDPLSAHVHWSLGESLVLARETESAIAHCRKGIVLHPGFWPMYSVLAEAYLQHLEPDLAVATLEKGVEVSARHPNAIAALASMLARVGRRPEAQVLQHELNQRLAKHYISAAVLLRVSASLDDHEEAFRWWDQAIEQRSPEAPRVHLWGSALQTLPSDPRYAVFMKRLRLA